MALNAHQPCIGCTLLTCHRLRSSLRRGSHSVHRSIHRSIQDHIHRSIHTRDQLQPWPQQQGQLQPQQTSYHRLRSSLHRGSHSVHRSIYHSVQDHIHRSTHTRGQLQPWPQQQGQLQPQLQQTSCRRLHSRGSHNVHRSIYRSTQDHVPRSIHDHIHHSIHTRDQLQPWPQPQGQPQPQLQQTSCHKLCRKGSHSSLHNDVQDRSSLHKEGKDQPLDRQLPLLQ